MAGYIIGIDIGTQGTKAVLFDQDMRIAASAFEQSKLISPKPGTVWQEADDIYGSCIRTIKQIVEAAQVKSADVLAIGVDSQMAGIMGVDAQGEAVTYYDSWLDNRCGLYMNKMREQAGRRVTEITGGPISYTHGPKIVWWKNEHPEAYRRIYKFVLPNGYVVGKMTGLTGENAYFDHTCIQYSGFGDNKNKVWSPELLNTFGIDGAKMARIVSPFEVVGGITKECAAATGLVEGIPVVAGSGDTAASILGSGLFENGMVLDCAGTASVLCSVVDSFVPDTEYETLTMMRSPVDGVWFPLAYINGGGLCLRWFRDEFTGTPPISYAELEEKAELLPPGSEGILFLPHFAGRNLPNNPRLKGSFVGLDWKHTSAHLFRAVMEGVAYEYHYYLKTLKSLYPGGDFRKMYISGGGAKSRLFNQIKADVLGVEAAPFLLGDTALVGIAAIAGVGAGVFDDYKAPIRKVMDTGEALCPDMDKNVAYEAYAAAYLQMIDSLDSIYKNPVFK